MGEKNGDELELRALVNQTENEQNNYGISRKKSEYSSTGKRAFKHEWFIKTPSFYNAYEFEISKKDNETQQAFMIDVEIVKYTVGRIEYPSR